MNSILLEEQAGIAIIYLNEPSSLNALSKGLKNQLLKSLEKINEDERVKVVIFTGKGRAFCAGGDLKAMANQSYNPVEIKHQMDASAKIIEKIRSLSKITISAIHGYAAGAGMSLALATDILLAEEDTRFVLSFKNVGLIPDLGLHYHLSRIIGEWKAKEWMWKGKNITVEEAKSYGFVMDIVPKGTVVENAIKLGEELIAGPVESYIFSKQIINSSSNLKIEDVLVRENDIQTILRGTKEHRQAVNEFFAKK